VISKGLFQLNLHDGSHILTKDKINVGDSLILDFSSKIKKHIQIDKGKEVFVFSGKYAGNKGKVESISDSSLTIKFKDKEAPVVLNKSQVIVR